MYQLWSSSTKSYPQSVPFYFVLECLNRLPSSHWHSYTLAIGFKGPLERKSEPQSFYVLVILKVTSSVHQSMLCLCLHAQRMAIFLFDNFYSNKESTFRHLHKTPETINLQRKTVSFAHSVGGLGAGQIGTVLEPCGETKIKPPYEETDVNEEERESGGPLFS